MLAHSQSRLQEAAPSRARRALAASIGRQIRTERLRKGFRAERLARDAGMSPAMWSRLENGDRLPSLRNLQAIASVLGVKMSRLLSVDEPAADKASGDLTNRAR